MKNFLTPELLAAAYDLLEQTPPFNSWNLPPSEEIKFEVTRAKDAHGDYAPDPHRIRGSEVFVGTVSALISLVAHEMVHLHVNLLGIREPDHGPAFRKLAAQVCRHHQFDPRLF